MDAVMVESRSIQIASAGCSAAPAASFARLVLPEPPKLCACEECGGLFYRIRHDQVFCKPGCRRAFHRRKELRGAKVLTFAMEWRKTRRKGGFAEFTQMIDGFLREDREREARVKKGRG